MLYSFSPILITICLSWGWHVLTMPYDIIISRIFYVVPLCQLSMWLMWLWQVMSHFVFFTYIQIKKKKLENKIKENKRQRKEKKNRIKPSLSFTTLTPTHIVSLIIDEDNSYWTQSLVFNSDIPNQHSLLSLDFIYLSEVVTIQQIDSTTHELKPRLFYKFVLPSTEFTHFVYFWSQLCGLLPSGVNCIWQLFI